MGHVAPEAAVGGPIAMVEDGDQITIDAIERQITLDVAPEELERRRQPWSPPPGRELHGALLKYARLVGSASEGAVTTKI